MIRVDRINEALELFESQEYILGMNFWIYRDGKRIICCLAGMGCLMAFDYNFKKPINLIIMIKSK